MTLGGKKISAETLNLGRESYTLLPRLPRRQGDGHGRRRSHCPPGRDFTQGKFKFAAVESGSLPNDDDFRRIIKKGLHGTAMLPWDVPDQELANIIQYVKTFSPKWLKESRARRSSHRRIRGPARTRPRSSGAKSSIT
jgi:hypothetical protein